MAETVTPSVRGAQRIRVVLLLALAGAATGGGVGAALGALPLPDAPLVPVVLAAVTLDAIGRPAPLAVRSQVPQLWGRILSPETAAVLYGARLGVGPLTILTSWLWWAALVVGVTRGPLVGAATGVAFHLARVAAMLVATAGVGSAMSGRIAGVRRREGLVRVLTLAGALALLAGCSSSSDDPPTARPTTETSAPSSSTPIAMTDTDLLLRDVLPGFARAPDDAFDTGPLDLAAAAAAERDADAERTVLETRGFVGGEARAWTGPDDDTVYAAVYEFASAAGAAAYLEDGRELLLARRVRTFPVDEPGGAFGFTQVDETAEGAFVGHAVAFVDGERYFLVIVGGDGSRRTADEARELARRQWQRSVSRSRS